MSRILYITQYASFTGGIERYEAATAKNLREHGHEVCLCFLEKGDSFDAFTANFTQVYDSVPYDLPFDCVMIHKLSDPDILQKLIQKFGKKLCAVIHDHDPYCPRAHYYTPFGRKNCSRKYMFGVCSFCSMIRNPRSFRNGIAHEIIEKTLRFKRYYKLLHRVSHFIVLSEFMRGNLIRNGFRSDAIDIIHPFVMRSRCPAARTSNRIPRIAFMGQLIKGKGPDTFLEMLSLLKHKYTAIVIGTGNENERLRAFAAENHLNVTFTGFAAEPEKLMGAIDLFVFPFRWQEPFGLVGIEAASSGVPVVAFETGGVREWLRDGFNGLAVSPDCVDELALAVDGLLENHYTRRELGKNGVFLARTEFHPDNYTANINLFLEKIKK